MPIFVEALLALLYNLMAIFWKLDRGALRDSSHRSRGSLESLGPMNKKAQKQKQPHTRPVVPKDHIYRVFFLGLVLLSCTFFWPEFM